MAPVLLLALAAAIYAFFPEERSESAGSAGERLPFDFWVLVLSWQPSYCAIGENADEEECRQGFGFLVHGLWPQLEQGYPEFCDLAPGPDWRTIEGISDLIPNQGLARHQWRRHGSCSGLTAPQYYQATRTAFERIEIPDRFLASGKDWRGSPDSMERAFAAANPGLSEGGMSLVCANGRITEARICLTRDFQFRDCEEIDARGCRAASITVPAAR